MATLVERKLSKEEFHARYDGEKPYYEYWDGEAVQKAMPTWLHGIIQKILGNLLESLGYWAASEVRMKLDSSYEPVPDVIAWDGPITGAYPTQPFEVAIEILSPSDPFSLVRRKCELYERWGIRQIVVIDPEARAVWRFERGSFTNSDAIAFRGGEFVPAKALWDEVDRRGTPPPTAKI
jgi:Uma2 family endonuclease